jgi:tRNA A-37 threonylcarbamoyl transferase component Bud32
VPISLQPGDLVERYRVEAVLGQGGTARVYRVRHTTLGTVHALKVLTLDHAGIRSRLLAEGQVQARMTHPNLVPVRDVLEVEGAPALLMDFVPGRSLQVRLGQGPLSVEKALPMFRGVVSGVGYAHGMGLVHRDLKPANVLLDESEDPPVPRVADFGLVRVLDLPEGATRATQVGMAMGTPGYMAPEQLRDARSVDQRADIFALGALFYCMLTGRPPFAGGDMLALMNDAAAGNYEPLSETLGDGVPPAICHAVDGCLRPDPDARFQDASALLAALGTAEVEHADPATRTWIPDVRLPAQEAEPADVHLPAREAEPASVASEPPDDALTASVMGLVVDQSGQGHAVEVRVRLDPAGSGVRHAPGVSRDAQVSAQLAVAAVLGDAARDWGVIWTVDGTPLTLKGTSLGLPLAVAVDCARHGRAVPAGWAFTGGVDLDGRVAPVSGVPAKLRAAQAAGFQRVVVPADGLGALERPDGVEIIPSRTLSGLSTRIFPQTVQRSRWWWQPRLLALLIPVVIAITAMSAGVEPLVHDPLLRAIHGRLPADNTVIIAFPPQADARQLRAQHPAVIERLVEMGVRAIFFDVTMTAGTVHDDAIATAIRAARERGVGVVLPVVLEGGEVMFPESASLREAAMFGAVLAHVDTMLWHVRRAPVRVRTVSDGDHWHAAVQTVRAHLSVKPAPRIEKGSLIIGPNRNPVWANVVHLHPAEPTRVMAYDAPDAWTGVAGRTAIIGEMGGSDDLHRTDADTLFGVEIEAALIETLLQQRAPRVAAPELDAIFALAVGLLCALVGFSLPRNRWWIAFLVPVAGTAIAVVLVVAGVLVALVPMLVSAGIGLWACRPSVVTSPSRGP